MKRARVGMVAAAVFAVASMAFAQAKPDFSGTWTLDPEASGMPAAGAPGAGAPGGGAPGGGGGMGGGRGGGGALGAGATVKQTADTLTIERTAGETKVVTTYKLDGTESKNTMMGRGGQAVESVSTAKFDGPKLTIASKQDMGGQMVESTAVWTVSGSTLTVESTNARGTQKRVYKK